MEFITTIEQFLLRVTAGLPHLPTGVRRWLSANIWWIILIISIVSFLGFGFLLLAVLAGGALATLLGGVIGVALGGIALGVALLSSLPGLIVAVILLMAVSPLRAQLAKGWRLVFLATLLDIAFAFIQLAFSFTSNGLLTFLVTAAIAIYILFELRGNFVGGNTVSEDSAPDFAPVKK